MVAVLIYGFNFKNDARLEQHKLHLSFWLAVASLCLYIIGGIIMTILINEETYFTFTIKGNYIL